MSKFGEKWVECVQFTFCAVQLCLRVCWEQEVGGDLSSFLMGDGLRVLYRLLGSRHTHTHTHTHTRACIYVRECV